MRTFVAVDIASQEVIGRIIEFQKTMLAGGLNARPVKTNQLHFTLMFLGEVSETMLDSIKSKIAEIRFEPIQVTYMGVGAFPSLEFPRVIWIGVGDVSAVKLVNLAKDVETQLGKLGFKSDKPFTPHLTVFRVKDRVSSMRSVTDNKDRTFGTDLLGELKLKKSDLTPDGPMYTDLLVIKGG